MRNPESPQSDFEWGALILFDVVDADVDDSSQINTAHDLSIHVHRADGSWAATTAAKKVDLSEFQLFGAALSSAFLRIPYQLGRYHARVAVVPVSAAGLIESAENFSKREFADCVLQIRQEVLPRLGKERGNDLAAKSEGTIFLLAARSEIALDDFDWRTPLAMPTQRAVASMYNGALVVPGLVHYTLGPDFTAICSSLSCPKYVKDDSIAIPEALLSLLIQLARSHVMKLYRETVCQLPFHSPSPKQYLSGFSFHLDDLVRVYLRKHLGERETTADALHQSEALWSQFKSEGQDCASESSWRYVFRPTQSRGVPTNIAFTSGYVEAAKQLEDAIDQTNRRMEIASEHLRDLLVAQVAESNFRLQQTLYKIAVGALLLSLMSLFVGLLPEDLKQVVWKATAEQVFGLFDRLPN